MVNKYLWNAHGVSGNIFSIQRLRHFQPAWFSLDDKHTNRRSVSSLASDAVENLGFFVPVGFDLHKNRKETELARKDLDTGSFHHLFSRSFPYLNQIFRKRALLIFRAADWGDDPVSFLSPGTLVRAGKQEHFRLGSRDRLLRGKKINKMKKFGG